jgi:hypothetical protein
LSRVVFAPIVGANAEPVRVRCHDCGQSVYTFEALEDVNAKVPAFYCSVPRVIYTPEHKTLPACADKYTKEKR